MPSFEFADSPPHLALTAGADGQQAGNTHITLRNTTARRQTARIGIEPLGAAKPAWFTINSAPATSPLEIEEDIDAGGTLTVEVTVKVPPKTPPGTESFRLRATAEASPDTDFTEGPAIAFEIAATPEPPEPAKKAFPWWVVAVAGVLVVAVLGAVTYLLRPRGPDPTPAIAEAVPVELDLRLVIGRTLAQARVIAEREGFTDVGVESGDAWGHDPADRIVVGLDPDGPIFKVDDGVTLPPEVLQKPLAEAAKIMLDRGVVPGVILGHVLPGSPAGRVFTTNPLPGSAVPLGSQAILTVFAHPVAPFQHGQIIHCSAMWNICGPDMRDYTVNDLPAALRERLDNRERMIDIVLGDK